MPGLKCSRPNYIPDCRADSNSEQTLQPGIKGRSTESHAQGFTCPSDAALLARTQTEVIHDNEKKKTGYK